MDVLIREMSSSILLTFQFQKARARLLSAGNRLRVISTVCIEQVDERAGRSI